MTRPLKLHLPLTVFERLWKLADGRGKKASVSKADLSALLMDHSNIIAKLTEMNVMMEKDYAGSSHVRQARS